MVNAEREVEEKERRLREVRADIERLKGEGLRLRLRYDWVGSEGGEEGGYLGMERRIGHDDGGVRERRSWRERNSSISIERLEYACQL